MFREYPASGRQKLFFSTDFIERPASAIMQPLTHVNGVGDLMTYICKEEDFTLPIFKVIDLRAERNETELHAEAKAPEMAAEKALGLNLVRAGNPRHLVCRVYWKDEVNT